MTPDGGGWVLVILLVVFWLMILVTGVVEAVGRRWRR